MTGRNLAIFSLFGVILLLILGSVFYFLKYKKGNESDLPNLSQVIALKGEITDIASSSRTIVIKDENGKEIKLEIIPEAKLFDDKNNSVSYSFYQEGMAIEARGRKKDESVLLASEIKIRESDIYLMKILRKEDEDKK
ncbi:hypothetical protein HY227_02580 [Candidatus Wolfebacteria bacterium]|nr:hypothetical protein [Candidatus Wolfebacteria bacterium]